MKRILTAAVLSLALGFSVGADSLESWVQAREDVKMSDLTVGDYKALAEAWSVERQEKMYVYGAAVSSFLIPGTGQFKVGDPLGGTVSLVGQLALVGATMYGSWALLPGDLQSTSLSHEARRTLMKNYWQTDPAKVAPAAGVMAGGMALALLHSVWSSKDAKTKAQANLDSDKVTFEPTVFERGLGFRMRM